MSEEEYGNKTRLDLINELTARDEMIAVFTGATGDEIAEWFKVRGRADDLPLLLKKKARIQLVPIETEIEHRHPLLRDWPDEVVDMVMTKMLANLDGRIREALFGRRAKAARNYERNVSLKRRTRESSFEPAD